MIHATHVEEIELLPDVEAAAATRGFRAQGSRSKLKNVEARHEPGLPIQI
jgi:hypothetical protein